MGKIYTIEEIREKVKPIAERYGIDTVWLFGSYARGEATEDSDVDLLISYKKLKGKFAIGGVFEDFAEALAKPVDVVSERALTSEYSSGYARQLYANAKKDGVQIYGTMT